MGLNVKTISNRVRRTSVLDGICCCWSWHICVCIVNTFVISRFYSYLHLILFFPFSSTTSTLFHNFSYSYFSSILELLLRRLQLSHFLAFYVSHCSFGMKNIKCFAFYIYLNITSLEKTRAELCKLSKIYFIWVKSIF